VSVQACEGVWRQKCGRYVAVICCEPREGGQRWTDGVLYYADNGTVTFHEGGCAVDLVEYIGPFPYSSQRAPVSRPAETESTTARYISTNEALDEKTAEIDRLRIELQETYAGWSASNSALADQATEIERLQAEWQSEFNAAQQLRSEVAQLERLLGEAREELQQLQADQAADEQHSEGERAAYLGIIKALWECERATS
jgi:hypothetical protein